MKHIVLVLAVICFFADVSYCKPKRRHTGPARNEAELMSQVITCLRNKDSISYYHLFPPFDTLWNLVLRNNSNNPTVISELNNLKAHPTILIDFDPFYNHSIMGRFKYVLRKGEDSGLQWSGVVMQRYELQKQGVAHGWEGLEHIAPERFKGFLFVRDVLSSTTYCITLTEIQKINGYYYGGQVINTLEANTIDDYLRKDAAEQRFLDQMRKRSVIADSDTADQLKAVSARDSTLTDTVLSAQDSVKLRKKMLYTLPPVEEDASKMKREIVDRKYYKGKFDDEIPVELYVRYMRSANGKITNWDGLYKFGDLQEYVKLDITKTKEGLWVMEEPDAVLELELGGRIYTGSWTNGATESGYDVDLPQAELSQEKTKELDYILENRTWGKTSAQKVVEKEEDKKEKRRGRRGRRAKQKQDKEQNKDNDKEKDADKQPPPAKKKGSDEEE